MWASSLTRTFLLTTLSSATRTRRALLLRPSLLHLEALPAAVACSDPPDGLPASVCPAVAATSVGAAEIGTLATDLREELLQTPLQEGLEPAQAAPRQSLASLGAGTPTTDSSEVLPRTPCACIAQARLHWHACQAAAALQLGLAVSSKGLLLQGSWLLQTIAATGSADGWRSLASPAQGLLKDCSWLVEAAALGGLVQGRGPWAAEALQSCPVSPFEVLRDSAWQAAAALRTEAEWGWCRLPGAAACPRLAGRLRLGTSVS